jgi:hypothetical protein
VVADGKTLPLRPTGGVLPLTLVPGQHTVSLQFSAGAGVGVVSRPPQVDLGESKAPMSIRTLMLPHDRWILFAWGKGISRPAILYWGEVVHCSSSSLWHSAGCAGRRCARAIGCCWASD